MTSVIIFDADGVILDSRMAHGKLIFDYAERYNHKIPSVVNGIPIHKREDVFLAMRSPMDVVFRDFGFSDNIIEELMENYLNEINQYGIKAYDGVIDAIKKSSLTSCIVSSNYRSVIEQFLSDRYSGIFDIIIGLEDVKHPKPNYEGLLKCLNKINTKNKNIYYFGDSGTDIEASKNLKKETNSNIKSVAVGWGYSSIDKLLEHNPDILLKDIEEFKKFLSTL